MDKVEVGEEIIFMRSSSDRGRVNDEVSLSRERMKGLLECIHNDDEYIHDFRLNYQMDTIRCTISWESKGSYFVRLSGGGFSVYPVRMKLERLDDISMELLGESLYDKVVDRFDTEVELSGSVCISMNYGPTVEIDSERFVSVVRELLLDDCNVSGRNIDTGVYELSVVKKILDDRCQRCLSVGEDEMIFVGFNPVDEGFGGRSKFLYCCDCIIDIIEENYDESIREEVVSDRL
jgi:hypothetical protein